MRITVRLFAILRDRAGVAEHLLKLEDGASVESALVQVAAGYPAIRELLMKAATAVNREYVGRDHRLHDGDELALIPPVSGGSELMNDWIEIIDQPLQVYPVVQFVTAPSAGGIDLFLGTTRQESNRDGQPLIALDYEAYPEMALARLKQLAERARRQWPIIRLAILHRVGRVIPAQPSVIIAVSTPHRADSFEACRFLIDQLKVDVPIWKKEIWEDGSSSWVGS